LQNALNSRVVIEQAKGVLAASGPTDMDSAFRALRRHARGHHLSLAFVAGEVVSGVLDVEEVLAGQDPARLREEDPGRPAP
ncbi:MAG: hypothetical protein JWN17_1024, partial [Frankiales bacterium]|nr:hypothetical protein [Frankiales bacterium]